MTKALVISRNEWVERIQNAWQIFDHWNTRNRQADHPGEGALDHGEFLLMIESELPFSRHTAQRLMRIAAGQRLTNGAHALLLPPHWVTLYELTKLPDEVFHARISDGSINPEM